MLKEAVPLERGGVNWRIRRAVGEIFLRQAQADERVPPCCVIQVDDHRAGDVAGRQSAFQNADCLKMPTHISAAVGRKHSDKAPGDFRRSRSWFRMRCEFHLIARVPAPAVPNHWQKARRTRPYPAHPRRSSQTSRPSASLGLDERRHLRGRGHGHRDCGYLA